MIKEGIPLLNKEYLYDMGITAIGDVMIILSHAKKVMFIIRLNRMNNLLSEV